MSPALKQLDHRPWPLLEKPWGWRQAWLDLAFVHFEADADELRKIIPPGLTLELFQGKAWVGIVPFRMERVTKRGWPAPSFLCDFPEINVRTYVTDGKKSGVWFLGLYAPHRTAAWFARNFFHVPYYFGDVAIQETADVFHYRMRCGPRKFEADYRPGPMIAAESGSFELWATGRYCLYCVDRSGRLLRGEVQHAPWPLQTAMIEIEINTIAGIELGAMHPSVLFSRKVDVVLWDLEQV